MYKTILTFIICLLFGISSLIQGQIRIAVSKTYSTYEAWLKNAEPSVEIVNMYGIKIDSAKILLKTCSGLLLSGGEDVNPARYGKENELLKCEEIDDYRDSLEFALIEKAMGIRMPIFGICRGEQILNVALGGTLLTDIPSDVGTTVMHRSPTNSDASPHLVMIDDRSDLFRLTGLKRDTVNSYHHQAIDKIAPGFRITAVSENGVAEAMERISPGVESFIMAVQWHPEKSAQKAMSKALGDFYLKHVREFSKSKR